MLGVRWWSALDNDRLRYELRSDGILYHLSGGIRALVKRKSPTRVQVELWRGDVLVAPETGDLGTGSFRSRLVELARERFEGEGVERLAEELGAVAAFLDANFSEREEASAEHEQANNVPELSGTPYLIIRGGLWRLKGTRGGEIPLPLTNFVGWVEEEIVRDDGAETRRIYRISGEADGKTLPKVEIPAAGFGAMGWVPDAWGVAARFAAGPGVKDYAREAMELLSKGAPVRRLYAHTGWREVSDGRHAYLHGGGAIGAEDVQVELEPGLEHYALPNLDSADQSGLAAAVRVSLRFLEIAHPRLTAPLLAGAYLAPLSEACPPDFSIWLWGETGSFKSTLAAIALSHFGEFSETTLPLSFESTSNSLERSLFLLKDSLAVVDDWRPGVGRGDAAELDKKAQRLLRASGNRQGRGRMTSETTLRRSYVPRGVIVATAESLPEGPAFESAAARALSLNVVRQDVDLMVLSELQAQKALLCIAMAGYIAWVKDRREKLFERMPAYKEKMRTELRRKLPEDAHPRTPDTAAALRAGLEALTAYALSTGVAEDEVQRFRSRAAAGILEAARAHVGNTKGGDPATRFAELLRSLFAAGGAYAKDRRTGGHPPSREELGWEETELSSAEPYRPVRGAQWVGWADAEHLYLDKEAAYAAVAHFAARGSIPFGIKPRALWAACKRAGISLADEGRTDTTTKVNGKTERVVQILRRAVLGSVENDA